MSRWQRPGWKKPQIPSAPSPPEHKTDFCWVQTGTHQPTHSYKFNSWVASHGSPEGINDPISPVLRHMTTQCIAMDRLWRFAANSRFPAGGLLSVQTTASPHCRSPAQNLLIHWSPTSPHLQNSFVISNTWHLIRISPCFLVLKRYFRHNLKKKWNLQVILLEMFLIFFLFTTGRDWYPFHPLLV